MGDGTRASAGNRGALFLSPGDSVNITYSGFSPDAYSYDIKVLALDSRQGYLWGVDLCSVSLVTFS